ncbi:hypothetical protein FFLO_00289 [Filobasidium floriforme]|uniref:Uncharacterized protein n=1 Tax=Filobasidium floriforme TaxID=5210 RepID=A0A8K0JS92_9TREE|nr:uncharacterized protein HD553DRAFT_324893 [Filobasidium floriforme]KAG7575470.1 hypothetical protein FFLO_00289 [Filobasidium floriforme]KAH8082607.1 hypothetical protein HD553DRAFT_324893 [Filobasidium floriforme]
MSSNTGTSGSQHASQFHYELSSCGMFINTYDNRRDRNLLATSEICRREDGSYREPTLRYTEGGQLFHFRDGPSVHTVDPESLHRLAQSTPLSDASLLLYRQPLEIAELFKAHRVDSSSLVPASASEQQPQDESEEVFKDNGRDVFDRTQEGPEMPVEQAGSSSEQLVKGRFDPLSAAFLKQLPMAKQGRDLEAAVHQALGNGMNIFTYKSKFGYCVQLLLGTGNSEEGSRNFEYDAVGGHCLAYGDVFDPSQEDAQEVPNTVHLTAYVDELTRHSRNHQGPIGGSVHTG